MEGETASLLGYAALRRVTAPFAFHLALVIVAVSIAQANFPIHTGQAFWNIRQSPLLNGLAKWDSGWFMAISVHGYSKGTPTETAFFPLYPICIHAVWWFAHFVASVLGYHLPASKFVLALIGVVESNAAFFASLLLFDGLLSQRVGDDVTRRTLWLVALFPTSFFFSAVYSEALFLFLTMLVFWLANRRKVALAAFAAGLACLTRVIGVILPICVVWMYLFDETPGWSWTRFSHVRDPKAIQDPKGSGDPKAIQGSKIYQALGYLIVAYAIAGLYPLYLWITFGHPLQFLHAESAWGRHIGIPGLALITSIAYNPLDWIAAVFAVVSMVVSYRVLPFAQWLYAAFGTVIPLLFSSGLDALSMPRLIIVLFPWFTVWAMRLRSVPATAAWFSSSVALLLVLTGLFSNWHWVA